MKWLVSLAGAGLVMINVRDLFHTLWHPTRHGGLSRLVMTVLWRLARRIRARRRLVGLGPGAGLLRLVSPLEALVGFALLTATVS
ncbi:hypothetical protein SAMN05216482_8952 [Streptomyces sp. PAN_FS17]|nr:hypothetical protein SAMN05216482_8952 [Streptomyces sp. PAN_FS17]